MSQLSYANSFDHDCEKKELTLHMIRRVLFTIRRSNLPEPDEMQMHPIQWMTLINESTLLGPMYEEMRVNKICDIPVKEVVNGFSDEISFFLKGTLVARLVNLALPKEWVEVQ